MVRVRIPQIVSLETAIRLYYSRIELSSKDVHEIFGDIADGTVAKLKNKARELMSERETPIWNARNVNTAVAFEAWGLEISDLERRYKKLGALCQKGV